MFKDLRQNQPFYILHKGEEVKLETGNIIAVSPPIMKPPTNFNVQFPQQPEMVVDVKVKIGDSTVSFEKLPADKTIADFLPNGQTPGQKIVVSTSKDLIKQEIEIMVAQSKGVIESVSYHEKVVSNGEEMLRVINPTFAKEKEQEDKISNLEKELKELKGMVGGIEDIKRMLQDSKVNNQKTTK